MEGGWDLLFTLCTHVHTHSPTIYYLGPESSIDARGAAELQLVSLTLLENATVIFR